MRDERIRESRDDGPGEAGGYRWACPCCGDVQVNLLAERESAEHAIEALRTHVRSSEDELHGQQDALPSDFDVDSLGEHVEFVDEVRLD